MTDSTPDALVACIPGLRRYARSLTGDAWSADDLVQDTLERACSKWRLWLVGSALRPWLFTLMHNLFVSQFRRVQRASAAGPPLGIDDVASDLAAPDGSPDWAIDLQRGLLQLPDDQREVLLLVAVEDLSYAEVARITRTPIGTVMSRLSRARARLRELVEAPAHAEAHASATPTPRLRRLK